MSNVTSFEEGQFPRDHASKRAKCICITRSPHVVTVCLLSNRKSKPDSYVDLSINMEDYHRIKNEENKT